MKPSVQRIQRVTDQDKRRAQLKHWLEEQKTATQINYSLLTLAMASDQLALDKYAVFYVCGIERSNRTTAVKLLDQAAHKYLTKKKCTMHPTYNKKITESADCPPLVKREYRPNEHPTKPYDLAVVYKDDTCQIPRTWVPKYVEGRGLVRDGYKVTRNWTMAIVHAANAISHLSKDQDVVRDWAEKPRQEIEEQLRNILQCYRFDRYYRMISEDSLRSFIFAGLALYDFDRSRIFPFKTETVELSKFLLKR